MQQKTKGNTRPSAVECFPIMIYNQRECTLQNTPPIKSLIINTLHEYCICLIFVYIKDVTKIVNFSK